MESDFRKEMDARLDATQARVAQTLMEHKSETSATIDAFRRETEKFQIEMRERFSTLEAKFDTMHADHKEGIAEVVKWVVGIFAGAMVSFVTVITFVLNHAS